MSTDWKESPLLRSSSALTVLTALAYMAVARIRYRPIKVTDAINAALLADGIYASGKMLYRCGWDSSFQPEDELKLYLVIGGIAILIVSFQALIDQYRRL
jgi:hypothetical protein